MSTAYQARKKQPPADPNITFFMDRFRKNITGQPIEELKPDSDEEAAKKAKEAEEEEGEEEYEEGAGGEQAAAKPAEADAGKTEGEKTEAEKTEAEAEADTEEGQPEAEGEAAEAEAGEGEAEAEGEEEEGGEEEEEGEEEEGEEEAEGEEAEGAEAQGGGTGAAEQPKDQWSADWSGQAGVEEYWVNNAGKGQGAFYAMQRMQEWNESGWPAWPPEAGNWGPEFDDVDATSWFGSKEAYYQAIGKAMPPSAQCPTAEDSNKETDAKAASGEEAKAADTAPVAEEAGECLDCTLIEDGLAQDDPFSAQQSAVPTESSKVIPSAMEVDKFPDIEARKRPIIASTAGEEDLKRQKLASVDDDVELLPLSRKPLDEVMILEHGYNGDESEEEEVVEAPQSPREIMIEANTAIATFLEDMPASPKSAALSPRSPKSSCPGSPKSQPPAVEESPKDPIAQPTMPVTKEIEEEDDREVDDRVSFQSMDHRDALLAEWEHIVPNCQRGMNLNKVRCCVKPCDREWFSSDLAARDPVNKYVEHYLMEHIVLDGEREMTEKVSIPTNGRCRFVHVLASCDMCCGQVSGIFEWNENYHFRRLCIQCHRIHSKAVSSLGV